MPRRARCIVPGMAYPITQGGVNRRETFSSDEDRETFLGLMAQNLADSEVRILGWCLTTNHLHLVALPAREDSLSVFMRRADGRDAQYYNARRTRSGHLWQKVAQNKNRCVQGVSFPLRSCSGPVSETKSSAWPCR